MNKSMRTAGCKLRVLQYNQWAQKNERGVKPNQFTRRKSLEPQIPLSDAHQGTNEHTSSHRPFI